MSNPENKVRDWLKGRPGLIVGDSPQDVMRRAWGMCGVAIGLVEFKDSLFRYGFKAEKVGPRWQLALPSDPTGGADPERHRALHNLTHGSR